MQVLSSPCPSTEKAYLSHAWKPFTAQTSEVQQIPHWVVENAANQSFDAFFLHLEKYSLLRGADWDKWSLVGAALCKTPSRVAESDQVHTSLWHCIASLHSSALCNALLRSITLNVWCTDMQWAVPRSVVQQNLMPANHAAFSLIQSWFLDGGFLGME